MYVLDEGIEDSLAVISPCLEGDDLDLTCKCNEAGFLWAERDRLGVRGKPGLRKRFGGKKSEAEEHLIK